MPILNSEQRARAVVANALAGCNNPEWWIGRIAKELEDATTAERQLRADAQEALGKALEELAVQKNRAENHVETLKAIASMPPTDGERMRLWARDELSGCWPLESALLKVSDERNAAQAQLAGETARREKLESRCAELAADELRACKACGKQLAFVRHRDTGRVAPYDLDGETVGVNHFITCPKAEQFRRKS